MKGLPTMSAVVKLSTKLPGDFETNGLDALAQDLLDDPSTLRLAVVWIDVARVVIDTDSGEHVPTVRIRRIEPVGDVGVAIPALRKLVGEAFEGRTGRSPLPFDIVEITEERHSDTLPVDES
jgi:hypothetical protein